MYLPKGWNGSPLALDFAITDPTKVGDIAEAASVPLSAANAYSSHKRTYLDTAEQCRRSGVEFIPMVAESTGAWSKEALAMLHHICQSKSRWTGRKEEGIFQELVQQLSVAIRSTNARAILRRVGEIADRLDCCEVAD